eukprot:TRINITY_DN17_c2_g1_i1.p1 TRINITY_DN17_c2_g1~~TRINITY_DN17_c2_g1_i1.p1  ORF type:complete len:120 (+),score=30.26 TRINITY_DN17_c2_g1_i1:24-383(+)
MSSLTKKELLQKKTDEFRKLQIDFEKCMKNHQTLLTQKNENEMVKQEFDLIEEDTIVYKLIGPVLVKQDTEEAKMNVEKRLELIDGELEKTKKRLDTTQKVINIRKEEMTNLQMQLQAQ